MGHYILNTGDEPLVSLEMFRSDRGVEEQRNSH
jgi:oxalate decarboxylase/phosphoglucose isomerase-like protein (cupin superfamily)